MNIFKKIKKVVPIIILFSLIVGGNLNIKKSYAIFGVGDTVIEVGANLATNLKTTIEQTIGTLESIKTTIETTMNTALHLNDQYVRDSLDRMAAIASKVLIGKMTDSLKNWISTGFNGKPLFLDRPEQYFQNVAQQQLSVVKDQVLKAGGGLTGENRNVAQVLVTDKSKTDEQRFQDSVKSTVSDADKNKFIDDFSKGGGIDTLLKITQDLDRNTDMGKLMLAKAETERLTQARITAIKEDLANGNGFLSVQKCIQYYPNESGGERVCKEYQKETPGIVAATAMQEITKNPIVQRQNVKTFNDALSALTDAFVYKLSSSITGEINGTTNSENGLAASSQGAVYDLNKVLTPAELQQISKDLKGFTDTILPDMRLKAKTQSDAINTLKEEFTNYEQTFTALNSVALCYQAKFDAQQSYLKQRLGQSASQSAIDQAGASNFPIGFADKYVKMPTSIPDNIRTNANSVAQKMRVVNDEINTAQNSVRIINEYLAKIQATTNYNEANDIYKAYYNDLSSGRLIDEAEMARRKQNNKMGPDGDADNSLFKILEKQREEAVTALNTCRAIPTVPVPSTEIDLR